MNENHTNCILSDSNEAKRAQWLSGRVLQSIILYNCYIWHITYMCIAVFFRKISTARCSNLQRLRTSSIMISLCCILAIKLCYVMYMPSAKGPRHTNIITE